MGTSITLKQILFEEIESTYNITEKLFHKVTNSELSWKPATGKNWMTVGQLLMHCANYGCGKAVLGFVKGDWGFPESIEPDDPNTTEHVPQAEEMPCVESVEEALTLLAADKNLALCCIKDTEEADLLSKRITAPWGGPETSLFQHLLLMITHLAQHKGQLFYYLKLMGKDVNTNDLWGE